MPLPNFLIIGAQATATRWLRINLDQHPEVICTGDFSYFNRLNLWRGIGWYEMQFSGSTGERFVGEVSPGYMMWSPDSPTSLTAPPAETAERINKTLPGVKLLAIVRDPVDRAYSAFLHHQEQGRIPEMSFVDWVEGVPPEKDAFRIISGSWYAECLAPFFALFGERLRVLTYEELLVDPAAAYRDAASHLGASEFIPEYVADVEPSGDLGEPLLPEERERVLPFYRAEVDKLQPLLGRELRWDVNA